MDEPWNGFAPCPPEIRLLPAALLPDSVRFQGVFRLAAFPPHEHGRPVRSILEGLEICKVVHSLNPYRVAVADLKSTESLSCTRRLENTLSDHKGKLPS